MDEKFCFTDDPEKLLTPANFFIGQTDVDSVVHPMLDRMYDTPMDATAMRLLMLQLFWLEWSVLESSPATWSGDDHTRFHTALADVIRGLKSVIDKT